MHPAIVLITIFPYDSTIDSVIGHQHLMIAYALTWVVHLAYLAYVGKKWFSAPATEEEE